MLPVRLRHTRQHPRAGAVRLAGSTHDHHHQVDCGLTTLTPEDYDATAPGAATKLFIKFGLSATMILIGSELGGIATNLVVRVAELRAKHRPDSEKLANALGMFDRQHQTGMRRGLLVIGVWSAFEAWAEDFTKGLMQNDRKRFEGKTFGSVTVTPAHLDTDVGRDDVWSEIEKRLDRNLYGIDRYESLFATLDLSGDVLDGSAVDIKPPFLNAFAIRNVWAHNAGYADTKFVQRSSGLGFAVGDLVTMAYDDQFQLCISALIMYPMIVSNRHREANGVDPMPLTGKPRDTPLGQAYLARYPEA